MLSYAFSNLVSKKIEEVSTEDFDSVWDLMAEILANGITKHTKSGLAKEYVNFTEDLSTLKGKLSFNESIKNLSRRNQKLTCNFDEYMIDTPFNQIIKSTMLLLIKTEEVKKERKKQLKKLLPYFNKVSTINLKNIEWNRFSFHRYNYSYKFILTICYLIAKSLILTTEKGEYKLMSFDDDKHFHDLYEKFLLEYFKRHYSDLNPSAPHIAWNLTADCDTTYLPQMETDVTLHDKTTGKILIIDAKCYGKIMQRQYDKATYRSGHIYQIYAYVKNKDTNSSGKVSGLLLYAKTPESEAMEESKYQIGGNDISIKTLNLNCEFNEIKKQLDNIIIEYFN